ncbi:hypothetical protein SELMODRAFT_430123 [Selaginella moellendorffii]|uniref:Uncharacterized protein n=1 Tax=Selaginella moellendorffii TaxID=88036 RepID=D8T8F1_SELML|nr:hypothetical protein SELMODRAFT_430123 [Selaginella moellendorffii]
MDANSRRRALEPERGELQATVYAPRLTWPAGKHEQSFREWQQKASSVSKTITFMYEALQFGDPIDVAAYIFRRLKKETETAVEAIAGGTEQVQTCVVPFYEALAWMGAETSRQPQINRVIWMDCPAEEDTDETEEAAEDEAQESVDESPKLKGRKQAAAAQTRVPKKLKITGRAKGKKQETPKGKRKQARAGTPGQGGKAAQFALEEIAKAVQADQVLLVNQEVFDRRFFSPLNAAVAEMKTEVNAVIVEMKGEVSKMAPLLDGERARILMNTMSCQKLSNEYYHMKERLTEVEEMFMHE